MSVYHGNAGTVTVGANTLIKIKSWQANITADTAETTGMGDASKSYLAGQKDGSGSVTCLLDHDDTTGQDALAEGATVTITMYPGGNSSGRKKLTATNCIITSLDMSGDMGGVPEITFSFVGPIVKAEVT